jgi:DNA ligase-1
MAHIRFLSVRLFISLSLLPVAVLLPRAQSAEEPATVSPPAALSSSLPSSPSLLLARSYTDKVDPSPYLVSEKLDGVRAYWDGKNLYFRSGRAIQAPAWFTAPFPAHAMDGELWMGRQSFERLSAAVRRQEPRDAEWKMIRYQLFELPGGAGSFSERIASLQASVAQAAIPWLQVLPQVRVADRMALRRMLDAVLRDGGEGLMLHLADAPWQTGRSDVLLKLKPQQDAEAVVVAHEPGHGKYQGELGALLVALPDGRRFRLGTGFSDTQRRHPPAIGSMVTYRYRDLSTSGLPKFPSFLRIREPE